MINFKVKFSDDETFVWQLPEKNLTAALANEMSRQALALAATKNINKFLSDVRGIRNIQSLLENYQFVHIDVDRLGYRRLDKIAVVHDRADHSHDFIEVVSANAGYLVKLFTDVQEAVTWLKTDFTPRDG